MTLHIKDRTQIPADTAALGQKLLDKNDPYRLIGDRLANFLQDADFQDLYAEIGGPAISPVLLALVLVFQMLEKLPDRAAARAVRVRLDWKYALHLPLADPGFHFTNLHHFRQRLLQHQAAARVFDQLVQTLVELGFIRCKGKVRTDATHILGAVAQLSRLELVLETLRVVLHRLHKTAPEWYQQHIPAAIPEKYATKRANYQLSAAAVATLLQQAGADGWWLCQQLAAAPAVLQQLPVVSTLRQIWDQQFEITAAAQYAGPRDQLPGSGLIQSPHDPDVRYSEKRGAGWRGYKAQVTETAEAKGDPNFILDIAATDAQLADSTALPATQERLVARGITPVEQYVDQAYMSTDRLAASAERGIDLRGPLPQTPSTGLFGVRDFEIDLALPTAICPAGHRPERWLLAHRAPDKQEYVFHFGKQCSACPLRAACTTAKGGRTVRYNIHRKFFEKRLAEMQTPEFWVALKRRPPVEGTISQLMRLGARRARYRGLAKVNLQLLFVGAAVNLRRLLRAWSNGLTPSWAT